MDVDNDIDGSLMQQFLSMGTQDKDVLISEFQKLLGNQLNPSACAFFLDMNNWNLQAAVCSYYDFEQPSVNVDVPCMSFVKDITVGEGESVRPGVKFVKTWRIKNPGTSTWPPGCSLKFYLGHQLSVTDRVMVDALTPGSVCDVSVTMTSPSSPGIYEGQWRMSTPTGILFGDTIWNILQVSEDGLLDITQEMSRFGGELSQNMTVSPVQHTANPFCSPTRNYINSSYHHDTTASAADSMTRTALTFSNSLDTVSTGNNITDSIQQQQGVCQPEFRGSHIGSGQQHVEGIQTIKPEHTDSDMQ